MGLHWPADQAVSGSGLLEGEIFLTVKRFSLHTAFPFHPDVLYMTAKSVEKDVELQVIHPSTSTCYKIVKDTFQLLSGKMSFLGQIRYICCIQQYINKMIINYYLCLCRSQSIKKEDSATPPVTLQI